MVVVTLSMVDEEGADDMAPKLVRPIAAARRERIESGTLPPSSLVVESLYGLLFVVFPLIIITVAIYYCLDRVESNDLFLF